jgi:hypothetical protein
MAKIIEAKAVITAEDKTGAVFDKVAKRIEGIAKSAKSAKGVDQLTKSLEAASKQMAAIDKYAASRGNFDGALKKLRAAQAAVDAQKSAMATIAAPNRAAVEAEQRRLSRVVDQASRAYEMQKAAVLANRAALAQTGVSVNNAVNHQNRLRSAIDAASAAIDRQAAKHERQQRIADRVTKGVAIGGAVLATAKGASSMATAAVRSAAEFDIGVRKQRAFVDIPQGVQDALLIPQAKRIGQDTQFSNLDVVKAQTTAMQGLPSAFTPELRAEVGAAIIENVKDYALVMEADMQKSAEAIRSFLQTTNKDISTKEKAVAEATRATNLAVKTAKLGGMNDEDAQQYFKYAAATGTAAGLSDTTLGALGAVGRRGGLRGDELGVFARSVSSRLVAPTSKGLDALTAAGIDYNQYTRMPGGLSVSNLEAMSKRRFGKGFNQDQSERLAGILTDEDVVGDKEDFTKQVSAIVAEGFEKMKNGKSKAQDSAKIAKAVGDFHKLSTESVDAEGLLNAIMSNDKMSIALMNAMFSDKHGGKGKILAGKWSEFQENKRQLDDVTNDPTFAAKKATEIMAGLGGSFERLKGSVENLQLSIGNAFSPVAKPGMDVAGGAIDWASNLHPGLLGTGAAVLGGGSVVAAGALMKTLMGGFGLSASAIALDGAAAALTGAAAALGGPAAVAKGVAPAAATGGIGSALWAGGAAALPWAGGAAAIGGSMLALRASVDSAGYDGMTSGERMTQQRKGSIGQMFRRDWNQDRRRLGIPLTGGFDSSMPMVGQSWTYGTGVGGGGGGQLTANVTGNVEGEAQVTVKVEAGSSLLQVVEQAKSAMKLAGSLNTNGAGSTGKSSPDAAAPARPSGNTGASGSW